MNVDAFSDVQCIFSCFSVFLANYLELCEFVPGGECILWDSVLNQLSFKIIWLF